MSLLLRDSLGWPFYLKLTEQARCEVVRRASTWGVCCDSSPEQHLRGLLAGGLDQTTDTLSDKQGQAIKQLLEMQE